MADDDREFLDASMDFDSSMTFDEVYPDSMMEEEDEEMEENLRIVTTAAAAVDTTGFSSWKSPEQRTKL
jgi:hypothetical protein